MKAERGLFREQAWQAQEGAGRQGAPLALWPRWIDRTYWFFVALAATGVAFALLVQVGEYARGPAVVRSLGRLDLATAGGGIVAAVDVEAGAHAAAGQILVRFQAQAEHQELERLDREFELKLGRYLLNPTDEEARQSLASLRASRELAAARLAERQVIAPRAGVVRNLRIRPGQMLAPGDLVLTLADEGDSAFTVVALVPGQFRPMLARGMSLRFELQGYPQTATGLTVEAVGDEIVGPAEVRRFLGQELGDAVAVEGSQVLVRARVDDPGFRLQGRRFRYYDGIPGRVEVRVRDVRLVSMLLPGLEAW